MLALAALPGEKHWLLEITTHFRPHYAVCLLTCAGVFLLVRRPRVAAVLAGFAVLNAVMLAPRFIPREAPPANGASVKLLLANVHSSNRDYAALLALVAREQPDLIALLEINDDWQAAIAPLAITHPYAVRVPRSDNFGIALFSRLPLTDTKIVFLSQAEVPSIRATFPLGGRPISLLATHPLPPGSAENCLLRDAQLTAIARWSSASATPTIVVGDLNCAPWSPAFRRLLKASSLKDTGSGLNPTWPVTPWWLRIPLDHCLVTGPFAVMNHHTGPDIGSDHFPIIVTLALPPGSP